MILGYLLTPPDNGDYMFYKLEIDECTKYSDIFRINRVNPDFKVSKKKKNITETFDGYKIVSEVFKFFCENEKYENLEFVPLSTPGFYWFKTHNIIEFDVVARETSFRNYNEKCKGYEEITGATPACLKNKVVLPDGFFRTDVCFGDSSMKSPLYMVGAQTKQKLKEAGFKEIYFNEILDKYDWQNK